MKSGIAKGGLEACGDQIIPERNNHLSGQKSDESEVGLFIYLML
jgi:hypothetical protein